MPPRFLVHGGRPLRGTVRPAGNKNAALPILAATLLADGPVELDNIPRIRDVETMLALLVDLGATAEWTGPNAVRVDARQVQPKPLDPKLCARIRASILLAGPLLARFGAVTLPPPGGDVIGRRRVDTHFLALEQLGASVIVGDRYELEAKGLRRGRHLPRRAQRHRHRERADGGGRGQGPHRAAQRRLRAARAGPGPRAGGDGRRRSRASGPTSTPSRAAGRSPARPTPSAPITSRSGASSAWRP